MKYLRIITLITVFSITLSSCFTRKSKLTTLGPNTTNPSQGVLNASGDGLTIGIPNSNSNRGSAISSQNAADIASAAINRANSDVLSNKNIDSLKDVNFLNRSLLNETSDISKSKAILNTTNNKLIKAYATMILNDHQKIQQDLNAIYGAEKPGVSDAPDSGLKPNSSSANSSSAPKSGGSDLEYLETMIADHRSAINLFTTGSTSKNPAIRSFSVKNLPLIRKHLVDAQQLKKTLFPK